MSTWMQRVFGGGETAPELYGRADQAKYQTGLKTCLNWIVQRFGGVINRPGTGFVSEVENSAENTAYIPFVFDENNSYILLFGDENMRVVKQGSLLTVSPAAWNVAVAYIVGDTVSYSGTNYYCKVANTGQQPDISPTYWYAMPGSIFEMPTPYDHTDVYELDHGQLGDVITIVHNDYKIQELRRYGDTFWTLTPYVPGPQHAFPFGMFVASGGAGTGRYDYAATAVSATTGEESLVAVSSPSGGGITGITQAVEAVVTMGNFGGSYPIADGDWVYIDGVVGMTELNGRRFRVYDVNIAASTTFKLTGIDSTGYGAYSSGGQVRNDGFYITSAAVPTGGAPHVISIDDVPGTVQYNFYKSDNGGDWGYIGSRDQVTPAVGTVSFSDTGITPNTSIKPPSFKNPFYSTQTYPSVVAYGQQRRWFGNSRENPEGIWFSKLGNFNDLSSGLDGRWGAPLSDDDGWEFVLGANQTYEVRAIRDLGKMVVFTSGSEHILLGGSTGAITPTGINAVAQSYRGSSAVRPATIDNKALFVQGRKRIIRDFSYLSEQTGQTPGTDVTLFGGHLFKVSNDTAKRLAYQETQHSVLWVVTDSGKLYGVTYMPEQAVAGWHRHSSGAGAKFLDVAVIPETYTLYPDGATIGYDAVYVLVEREIDGNTVRYVERMPPRELASEYREMRFLDSHLTYNGTNLTTAGYDVTATATLTTGAGWTQYDTLTLTMSANTFVAGDVGNGMWLTGADGERVFVEITAYTSPTVVSCKPNRTVPASLQSTASTTWGKAVDTVSGLDHLEDEEVYVLADGFVVTPQTVASGSITLPRPYVIIHVGLQYNSDLRTLKPEVGDGTIINRQKLIKSVNMDVVDTRGLWAGPDEDNLYELKMRADEHPYDPVELRTDRVEILVRSQWDDDGELLVRQIDPLPANILSIAPMGMIGD